MLIYVPINKTLNEVDQAFVFADNIKLKHIGIERTNEIIAKTEEIIAKTKEIIAKTNEIIAKTNNAKDAILKFIPSRKGIPEHILKSQLYRTPITGARNDIQTAKTGFDDSRTEDKKNKCLEISSLDYIDISGSNTVFYIYDTNKNIDTVICLHNDDLQKYLNIDKLFYQCKPEVPETALNVSRLQTNLPLVRIDKVKYNERTSDYDIIPIYINARRALSIVEGGKYALIPTDRDVGRLVSETYLQTKISVGEAHCQAMTIEGNGKIYNIFDLNMKAENEQNGGRSKTHKTKARKIKSRKNYK